MLEFIETTLFYLIRLFSSTIEMLFAFLLMNAFFEEKYKSKIPKIKEIKLIKENEDGKNNMY